MTHLVEKKPPFVESNTVHNCHNCEHAFIDSRINCRACGNVVCDECSKNRIWLPYLPEGEPENVCDNCFDKIQGLESHTHPSPLHTKQSSLQYEAEIGELALRCCRCTENFKEMQRVDFCEKCKRAFCIKCLDASDHHKNKDNICDNCKDDESERRSSSSGRAGSYDPTDLSDNCCDSDCCMLFCECMELGVAIGELCCCLGGIICSDLEDD
ncbi:uncharacterized protein LOC120329506 [Styela clava]